MTVKELFDYISANPQYLLFYFIALPVIAWIIGILGDDKCHKSPWREMYMVVIYAVMIPGIFAMFFNLYLFLFENNSIFNYNIFIQILPVISMIVTLFIIRRYVSFADIPGFDRIPGLIMVISSVIIILWIVDRFRIIAFTYLPFHYFILIFIALLIAFNWGLKKLTR